MVKYRKIFNDIHKAITNGSLMPGDKIPTGNELCKKYGVSRITSVRAMNDLEAQGYIKKIPGRGTFVSDKKKILPMPVFHLLTPGIRDLFYHQMSRSFARILMDNSALGAVLVVQYNLDYLKKTIDCILSSGTQGIVLMHSGRQEDLKVFSKIANSITDVPVIIAQRHLEDFPGIQILVDEVQGGYIATKHLISLGHSKLAYMGLRKDFSSAVLRFEGFLKACDEAGIPECDRTIITKNDLYTIMEFKERFKAKNAPTATVSPSEDEAFIAYELLSSFDIKIPENLALVTIYGSNYSNAATTPFTSVDWPGREMGEVLAKTLLKINKNPDCFSKRDKISYLTPYLIIRNSCGATKDISRHELLKRDISFNE